jgi:hypothetical protein
VTPWLAAATVDTRDVRYERTPPEVEHLVVDLYTAGVPLDPIVERTRVSSGTVYEILKRHRQRPTRTWVNRRHRQHYDGVRR